MPTEDYAQTWEVAIVILAPRPIERESRGKLP